MRFFLIIYIFLFSSSLYSQKKDFKNYDKAFKYFKKNNLDKSKEILIKIIERNNSWDKPYLLLSNIYFIENDIFKSSRPNVLNLLNSWYFESHRLIIQKMKYYVYRILLKFP